MLKNRPGIKYVEQLAGKDGDAFIFAIESEYGVDVRKSLYYACVERNWPLIGLEALGMSLEDIFITIVDSANEQKRTSRKKAPNKDQHESVETTVAHEMMKGSQGK